MGSCLIVSRNATHKSQWARVRTMREASPRSRSRCTRTASSRWTSTRTAPWTRMASVELLTTSESSCPSQSWTTWAVGGPCNVMGMINMFQEKMAGDGNDPDELILQAFMAYDQGGKMDVKMFQHALSTWGDKMTKAEIDDVFNEFEIDEDFMVKTKEVVGLFVAVKEEEKKVEEPAKVEEVAPAE